MFTRGLNCVREKTCCQMNSGVYKIENLVNGKCYIGSTKDFRERRHRHKINLENNRHINPHLQSAYNKYGKENFMFEVVEYVKGESNLLKREQHYLDNLSLETLYNISRFATSPMRGRKHTDEWKSKMSVIMSGKTSPNYGRKASLTARLNMSKAQTGKTQSKETVARRAKSLKGRKRPQKVIEKIKQTKAKQQHYNSRYITFNNKTKSLTDWGKEVGINPRTIRSRLNKGWSVKKALTQKVRPKKKPQAAQSRS